MAPLEIRHRSVRPISAKHAQASRFLQQSPPAFIDIQYHDRGSRIPNANGGQSPTFDCFAITRGGTHVVDSRKLDEAKKPSILVMLLERLGAQS
jgi:hypothetical protein